MDEIHDLEQSQFIADVYKPNCLRPLVKSSSRLAVSAGSGPVNADSPETRDWIDSMDDERPQPLKSLSAAASA